MPGEHEKSSAEIVKQKRLDWQTNLFKETLFTYSKYMYNEVLSQLSRKQIKNL